MDKDVELKDVDYKFVPKLSEEESKEKRESAMKLNQRLAKDMTGDNEEEILREREEKEKLR